MILRLSVLTLALVISSCTYLNEIIKNDPFLFLSKNKIENFKIDFKEFDHSENKEEYKFVAIGDAGSGFKAQYNVAKAIENKCKNNNCDFILYLGDNFYNSGVKDINDKQFIDKFEKPYKNIDLNFYTVLGNHDYRGNTDAELEYYNKNSKFFLPSRSYKVKKDFIDYLQ